MYTIHTLKRMEVHMQQKKTVTRLVLPAVALAALAAFFLLVLAPTRAAPGAITTQTIMLTPAQDNTLYEDEQGALSNGAGQYLFAGNTSSGSTRRGLLAFDLIGIPADATIISASLTLTMSKSIAGETPVALHALAADWGEGASDAPDEEGEGTAAQTGDATWLHTFFNTGQWAQPGGDFDPAPSAVTVVGGPGAYTWNSAALAGDVIAWLADPSGNFGWALLGDESANRTAKRFDSRENVAANRPRLTVTYMVGAERVFTPVVVR